MSTMVTKKSSKPMKKAKGAKVLMTLDEQIAALESSLADSGGGAAGAGDDDTVSSASSHEDGDFKPTEGAAVSRVVEDGNGDMVVEKDDKGNIVRIYSRSRVVDAIPPLSRALLPGPKCGFQMHAKTGDEDGQSRVKKPSKRRRAEGEDEGGDTAGRRRVSFALGEPAAAASSSSSSGSPASALKRPAPAAAPAPGKAALGGLERTVRELVADYVPTSHYEKRPFWCRICRIQSENEEDFNAHRESALHLAASAEERKRSECRLCRKQFTSPAQLKEHLVGTKHKERLAAVKQAQGHAAKFC